MGTSYQDIDIRLKRLEELVNFMASTIQMKAKIQGSGLVDADGRSTDKFIQGSMWDLFRFSRQIPVALQSDYPQTEGTVDQNGN